MSMLGSSTASGRRSGVVSSSTSKSRPPSRKRASRRKRGSLLATRTRARGSSPPPSYVTAPRSTRASAALREAHATRSPTSSPRRRDSPCRKLDHLARAAARDGAPGPDLVLDLDDDLVGVEEDRVDGKAHERGVDAPARPQHHALALPEILATEQPSHAAMGAVGHDDALADDPTVFPAERQCRHGSLLAERVDDADDHRRQDHDEECREDEEDQWEEHLDRHLLRPLFGHCPAPLAHLE